MKIVIIEDEEFAARRLERMIIEIEPEAEIAAKLESVSESVKWLKENVKPDLIFADIHLEDGLSFTIFEQNPISCPVVFTTATDEHSTGLFRQYNIAYLLKPIASDELEKIIHTHKNRTENSSSVIDPELFKKLTNQRKQ